MFFSISNDIDHRFPNHQQVHNLWINLDNGWQKPTGTTFYKGYIDNYCQITVDSAGASIDHSTNRSFPLWYRPGFVTNLPNNESLQPAWADDRITINSHGQIIATKIIMDLTVSPTTLTVEHALQQLKQCLDESVHILTKNNNNLKLFCSGGVDTFLLYGLLHAHNIKFELVVDEHFELDLFNILNQSSLESLWAYKQIHHWTSPTWLATGSCGDEYFLRGPAVIAMLTAWHNINFGQIIVDHPEQYHYHHFNKYTKLWTESWDTRQDLRRQYPSRELLNQQILNILLNDHQHWHLGETITWTPFKNIELVKILLRCDINDLLPQFLNGELTKKLILQYCPALLKFVSTYKNYNSKENLINFVNWHKVSAY